MDEEEIEPNADEVGIGKGDISFSYLLLNALRDGDKHDYKGLIDELAIKAEGSKNPKDTLYRTVSRMAGRNPHLVNRGRRGGIRYIVITDAGQAHLKRIDHELQAAEQCRQAGSVGGNKCPSHGAEYTETTLQELEVFFNDFYIDELRKIVHEDGDYIAISLLDVDSFSPKLGDELLHNPRDVVARMEEAITQLDLGEDFVNVHVRIKDVPKKHHYCLWQLRANNVDKLISCQAVIRQASDVLPEIVDMTFHCTNCSYSVTVPQEGPKLSWPKKCVVCGGKNCFEKGRRRLNSVQQLVLEDPPDASDNPVPARRRVILRNNLTDPGFSETVVPGTDVIVTGILGAENQRGVRMNRQLDFVIDALDVEPVDTGPKQLLEKMTPEQETEIRAFAQRPDIFKLWRSSIGPVIHGHDVIKEALALFLMGGVSKMHKDSTATRGDIHILLIGDPGSGKSMLLRFIENVAPRARRAAGKGASGVGLTAAVVKDEYLKTYALEAGTLVLADRGVACIDELDKVNPEEKNHLHEAMEQQTVTISKANIQVSLKARCGILAAANPKRGRFDPYQPPAQQIDMPPTLINRFDLIFVIKDRPDEKKDGLLADHVLAVHSGIKEPESAIPLELLPFYIALGKRLKPTLDIEARQTLKSFFLHVRKGQDGVEHPIPINVRQLESMTRLAEASARIRLAEIASVEDAKRAIRLTRDYLTGIGIDPHTGELDMDWLSGTPMSFRELLRTLESRFSERNDAWKEGVAFSSVFNELDDKVTKEELKRALSTLVRESIIFEPRPSVYKSV